MTPEYIPLTERANWTPWFRAELEELEQTISDLDERERAFERLSIRYATRDTLQVSQVGWFAYLEADEPKPGWFARLRAVFTHVNTHTPS